ncbi:mitochondrial import inner membrane translocase subunit Tim9-like [Mizuhopecten yessoensis]|uniref:mitochondrial import inner membrane translocase subunit Tim9-like n=1 Tax=Mizuhopecten yessoensis TaxID=6573 RepID=UPI000B45A409|nr:mitochondrial import inner membrane translocase subunit Tim9-like [Mizuhopecten yessoensis]XP_021351745.1 mitochondrial import inner membrane translocase subunit Tim9-like [Mizuhopecten yessoensis]XP_021351746.1 mitochondrial import inner membrane translocase subunit Tim9-like [Mizuhopecten yessoensis]
MAAQEPNMMQVQDKSMWRALLLSYNKLGEECFVDCVHDFTSKKPTKPETKCANNCLQKHARVTQRITQRISEFQMTKMEGMEAPTAQR